MADYTMCKGGSCPFKEKCERFTSTANEHRQAWFIDVPYEDGKCDMYWGENQESIYNQLIYIVSGSTLPPIEIKEDNNEL
jgi:hypothetical protein